MVPGKNARIALLYGGHWEEREVSIESAAGAAAALVSEGLVVTPVRWDVDGWVALPDLSDGDSIDLAATGIALPPIGVLSELVNNGLGIVFNCLHGGPGEDGTVQGFLELSGVPYTGASVSGSAVTGNKHLFRCMAQAFGFEVPAGMLVQRLDWLEESESVMTMAAVEVGFPLIVKPVSSGSSMGVYRVADGDELLEAVDLLLERERSVLVEKYIPGRELSIGCLGTKVGYPPQVLPPAEIEPLTDSGIFDTEAKYQADKVRETVPANVDAELLDHLEAVVSTLHMRLDLGAMSRTDLILGADGPVLLESNSVPGLTEESIFPKAAAAAGIDYTTLCRRVIDYALSAHLARGANTAALGL